MHDSEDSMKYYLAAYTEAVREYYDVYWGEIERRRHEHEVKQEKYLNELLTNTTDTTKTNETKGLFPANGSA